MKGKKEFEDQISKLRSRKETLQKDIEEREKWNVREEKILMCSSNVFMDETKNKSVG